MTNSVPLTFADVVRRHTDPAVLAAYRDAALAERLARIENSIAIIERNFASAMADLRIVIELAKPTETVPWPKGSNMRGAS